MDRISPPASSPAPGPDALTVEDVTFGYRGAGGPDILRGVTLRVRRGERVGLLGPNGAGKSTLLRLASGVLRPGSGRVLLAGAEVRALPRDEVARRVAVVPQDFSVRFAYTVRQLVELGRTAHAGSWGVLRAADRQAVARALAATDLDTLADRVFNELSGGERQRVLVAMALAQASPVVLLDEPTAHLDIRHQIEVLELLRRLNHERGLTVLAALHDLNLAARYFPRLVLFRNEIIVDGPPAAVLDPALLSRVYETPVRVGRLAGETYLSVLPLLEERDD
ncbi:MAG TPA: ABC transporter ATP-binding protein [Ktedonobacterales bacterium]